MRRLCLVVLGLGLALGPVVTGHAEALVVTETTNDALMLFNAYDGSLINSSYLDMTAQDCGNPISVQIVGANEFWVTDKSNDQILRYQLDDNAFLGAITGTNIVSPMGIEVNGTTAYVANASSSLKKVTMFNTLTHAVSGTFAAGATGAGIPYDVQLYNPDGAGLKLLVDDQAQKNLDLFTLGGTFVQTFHHSTGTNDYSQPQQMSITSGNSVLVAGSTSLYGVFEFDNNGNQVNRWTRSSAVRGVYELRNGNILFTDGSGVHVLERSSGTVTDVYTGVSANYIEKFIPEPGSLALVLLGGLAILRRR